MPFSSGAKTTMLTALPNTVYAAFFSGGAPGSGSEVAAATLFGSGTRPAVVVAAESGGERYPTAEVDCGDAAPASTSLTHVAYYDAASGGNLLGYSAFAHTVTAGEAIILPVTTAIFGIDD